MKKFLVHIKQVIILVVLSTLLILFHHVHPQQRCTSWKWWKPEKSRIDQGSQGDSVWFWCFDTSISPVSHVGSGVKLNLAISVNLVQAWASLHLITGRKPLSSAVVSEQKTYKWLIALSLNHRGLLPRLSSNPTVFGEHSVVKKH